MGLREGRGPIANAIGIAAGITIGGVIVKASPPRRPTPLSTLSFASRPSRSELALTAPPASPPTEQRMNSTGGDVARLNFPRLPLSSRRKTIEVTLGEGQTVGELVCKYVGEYTEENLRVALDMNKDRIDDVDFVQPGTVIRLPDNRRPKLATPEAEWWDGRGMGAAAREAPEGATGASEPGIAPADVNRVPAKDANNRRTRGGAARRRPRVVRRRRHREGWARRRRRRRNRRRRGSFVSTPTVSTCDPPTLRARRRRSADERANGTARVGSARRRECARRDFRDETRRRWSGVEGVETRRHRGCSYL